MSWETVLYEKTDGVAKIIMNRPEVLNAESTLMSKELQEAFKVAESEDDVRVIILAGAGSDFSSGHDIGSPPEWAARQEKTAQDLAHNKGRVEAGMLEEQWRFLDGPMYIRDIWKPTIAQVQGQCFMGGFMLACMCDLIMASEDATFTDMGQRYGVPSVEYFCRPWELGIRKAKEFLFTCQPISAEEAWRLGMVNHVVPREQLEEETRKMANQIALGHPFALKVIKMACNATQDIQGFKPSMLPSFLLHQLGHAYTAQNPDHYPSSAGQRRDGSSIKEQIIERDKAWQKKE